MPLKKYLNPKNYWRALKHRFFPFLKSYAQTGEDLILNFYIGEKKNGFYVDIGANHPKRFSNTFFFYKKGWRGINIEPDPRNFNKLKRARPRDINLNVGVSERRDNLDFFMFQSDTLSTFSRESAEEYKKLGYPLIGTKKVTSQPLNEILDKYLPKNNKIDFFSIDTEGYDFEVLKSNDWKKYRPHFIILETLEFKDGGTAKKKDKNGGFYYDHYLGSIGYKKMADTYINSIYIEDNFAAAKKIYLKN